MASVFRVGIIRLVSPASSQRLCKVTQNHNATQVAPITSRATRAQGELEPKPAPFPYWKKKYSIFNMLLDQTVSRFDENTRLIVVDGPPAVGKSTFAKKLAEQLDMLYMPAPVPEDIYINHYGVDFRKYNNILPPGAQCVDMETYYTDPRHKKIPLLQWSMYHMRFEQYVNALMHLLSTGQGVVLNRCVFSDGVFSNVMHRYGFISSDAMNRCSVIRHRAEMHLCRPHLVIYLDASVDQVQENIKKRNIPYEVNSKLLTAEYLSNIESMYKSYLREMGNHAYMMVYDWESAKDIDWIVNDIERLDMDNNWERDRKHEDWDFDNASCINHVRDICTNQHEILNELNPEHANLPDEFYDTMDENAAYEEVILQHQTEQYEGGYNPDKEGVQNVLTKFNQQPLLSQSRYRRRCRDFDYLEESLKRYRKAN